MSRWSNCKEQNQIPSAISLNWPRRCVLFVSVLNRSIWTIGTWSRCTTVADLMNGRLGRAMDMIFAVVPVCIGSLIYLLFRTKDTWIIYAIGGAGGGPLLDFARTLARPLNPYVSGFALYSLPSALWAFSFMFCIVKIWADTLVSIAAIAVIALTAAVVLGSEVGQALDLVQGRFDVADVAANAVGLSAGGLTAYATQRNKLRSIC